MPLSLTIHNTDIHQLCQRALNAYIRTENARIPHHDHDDYLADLYKAAWTLAQNYKQWPGGPTFDQYAYPILRLRPTDTARRLTGRTKWTFATHEHTRERPTLLSLDAPADAGHSRLGELVAAPESSDAADSDETQRRHDRERNRHRTTDLHVLRTHLATRRAA